MTNPFLTKALCTQCGIKESRVGKCLLQSPPSERREIVVVSQAPIMADVLANDAFDSRGGLLVRGLLNSLGFNDSSWTGTYSVLCVPPDNSRPPASALAACRPRLIAQVQALRPKVVVALGEVAINSLARSRAAVTVQRGMPYWHAELNAYVLPTHHPRFAMEQPSAFYELASDFEKISKILRWQPGIEIKRPTTKHYVVTQEDKAIATVEYIRQKASWVAADVETQGFNFKSDKIICEGFSWEPGLTVIFDKNIIHSPKVQPYLKQLHEDGNIEWVWHNGKFDIKFLQWQHDIRARVDFDTMLAHYALNERRGTHDLEQVAMELIYAEPWEYKLEPYKKLPTFRTYEDIPKPVLHEYLGKDVDYTGRTRLAELEIIAEQRNRGRNIDFLLGELLMPGANAFTEVETNGIYIDRTYVEELKEYFIPLIEEHVKQLQVYADELGWNPEEYAQWWTDYAMSEYRKKKSGKKKPPNPTKPPKATDKTYGHTFNPNSHQQLKFVMYELMHLPLYKKEMTSNKEARKWYMENCDMQNPFIERLDKLKKDGKLFSTYVEGIDELVMKEDGKLHPTFNLHGTETGRLSSSEPNVQNIPRDSRVKNEMVAEPDDEFTEEFGEWMLLQADYSQAELRVLAVLGGSPWLQGVYYRGEDLHDAVSLQLYGPNFTKEQRVRAKAVNFGIPYGRTEYTLADEHHMRISEARKLIADWFEPQPETRAFMDARRAEPLEGKVYTSPTGRQRSYGLITEHNKRAIMNEAGNMPIQGTASDCTLRSVIEIVPATKSLDIYRNGKRIQLAKVVNSVHDSIILQVRANLLPQVTKLVNDIMTSVPGKLLNTDMPFVADFEAGYRWGSVKGYDYESGLITWEDKNSDGGKIPRSCTLEVFRQFRGDTKQIVERGLLS